jgi:hypothetical protein
MNSPLSEVLILVSQLQDCCWQFDYPSNSAYYLYSKEIQVEFEISMENCKMSN